MIKRSVLLCFLLMVSHIILSQNKIDSLITVFSEVETPKNKLEVLNSLTTEMIRSNHPEQIAYLWDYVEMAFAQDEYDKGASKSRFIIQQYLYKGEISRAMSIIDSMMSFKQQFTNSKPLAHLTLKRGGAHFVAHNYDQAIKDYDQAALYFLEVNDSIYAADAYLFAGQAYNNQGKFVEAIEYLRKANDFYFKLNDLAYVTSVNNEISVLLERNGLRNESIQQRHKNITFAKRFWEEMSDELTLFELYTNIGNAYFGLGNLDLAEIYLDSASEWYVEKDQGIRFKRLKYVHFLFRADLSIAKDDLSGVEGYMDSLKIYSALIQDDYLHSSYLHLQAKYEKLKGNVKEALRLVRMSLEISESESINEFYVVREKLLADLLRANGDMAEANKYYQSNLVHRDSIYKASVGNTYAYQQAQFKTAEKEQEITQQKGQIRILEAEKQVFNLRMTIVIVVAILLISIGVYVSRLRIKMKAKEAERLREVSSFKEAMTGMIAHDLKNPLGIILGTESEKPSTRQMARQMLNLVDNMLDVHKFESTTVILDPVPVSISSMVTEAIEQVRPLISEKNIRISTQIDNRLQVNVDQEYMKRVLVNLFTNAIKYSHLNSTIEVETQNTRGNSLEIAVIDHGEGIAAENLNKIFESFGQVDPKSSAGVRSTGLGLSFCQLAVRAHGSELKVDSKVGKGTKFTFELELLSEQSSAKVDEVKNLSFNISKKERELIISKIPELKALKLHQALAIEEILEGIEPGSATLSEWSEQLLNAAYANNQAHYNELLDLVESVN